MKNVKVTRTITSLNIETGKMEQQEPEELKSFETVQEGKNYISSLATKAFKKGLAFKFIECPLYGLWGVEVRKSEVTEMSFVISLK